MDSEYRCNQRHPRELRLVRSTGRSIRWNAELYTRRSRAPSSWCTLQVGWIYNVYIGLKLSHIFGGTEEVSHLLQSKKATVDVTRLYNKCKLRNVFSCGSAVKRLSVCSTTNYIYIYIVALLLPALQCCPGWEGFQYDMANILFKVRHLPCECRRCLPQWILRRFWHSHWITRYAIWTKNADDSAKNGDTSLVGL